MAETALNRARIAVDAMGGDYAPNEIIAGSMRASEELDVEVLLVGDSERIEAYFQHHPRPKNLTIVHAEEVVAMDEEPITAIRRKPAASINVAMDLVKQNRADAVVAAGHSGAAHGGGVAAFRSFKRNRSPGDRCGAADDVSG